MQILILSPNYPTKEPGNKATNVVHYFVKEWKKIGSDVLVVHMPSFFPSLFYHMPKFIEKEITKKFGALVTKERQNKIEKYSIDDVPILKLPIFKFLPGKKVGINQIEKIINFIIEYLNSLNFKPDVIVGHWTEPTLPFVSILKNHYNCKSVLVTHSPSIKYYEDYAKNIDLWGYRSIKNKILFENNYPYLKLGFRCYSGIPEVFLKNRPKRDFQNINNYIFVGTLIQRKYPDILIEAFNQIENDNKKLNIIGEGVLIDKLKIQICNYRLNDKINLFGKIERQDIINYLDQSDIFIMVSRDEVFGLVYIEAMARGCIVIASKNEGMEGIIKHGYNGFLIEAGKKDKLIEQINIINKMTPSELQVISNNAIETAFKLTDKNVANDYLNEIKKI